MSRLPVETTSQILGYLDLSTQSACALTCRTFLQETRRSRFRKVALNGDKTRKLLRLTTAQDVLRCVRKLRLEAEAMPWQDGPGDRTSSWIPGLLKAFPPNLPVQTVRLFGFDDVTEALIVALASKFTSIERLYYDYCALVIHPDDLALLILPFPELRVFKFCAANEEIFPSTSADSMIPRSTLDLTTLPRPHRLSRLIYASSGPFDNDNRASAFFDAIVTHKLHEHIRDLCYVSPLELQQQPGELATFATYFGPRLTSLTLGSHCWKWRSHDAHVREELVYAVAAVRNLLMLDFLDSQ